MLLFFDVSQDLIPGPASQERPSIKPRAFFTGSGYNGKPDQKLEFVNMRLYTIIARTKSDWRRG
jgi:hypothetical protein